MRKLMNIASLLLAAAVLFSCDEKGEGPGPGSEGELRIVLDKDVIQNNGTDAAELKVMCGDEDVTADAVIYNDKDEVVTLKDGKFTSTHSGIYKFWAAYGAQMTYDTEAYDFGYTTVKVIPIAVPEKAADLSPEKTSFVRRVFIAQSTGSNCKYCPGMVMIMRQTFDEDRMVRAAIHNFGSGDPAYLAQPSYGTLSGSGVPSVCIDFATVYEDYTNQPQLANKINQRYEATEAKVGISVNSVIEDDMLIIRASVKAAETGRYNIGAWLLEDRIYAKQADELGVKKLDPDHDYDTHDNCVRVADSSVGGRSYVGYPLGEIKAGGTADKTFVMSLFKENAVNSNGDNIDDSWKVENLHLVVFVTEPSTTGLFFQKFDGDYYTVNNVIDCDIDCEVPFEYAE